MTNDFDIKDKVALVTGAACGLGFEYTLDLLKEGARGVTLADVNEEAGKSALEQIERTFGKNRAIFVKCDVTKFDEFENAFKITIDKFKNIDILINNAGIADDSKWEQTIAINLNGVVHGMLLGLDKFIPTYKSGKEGLIVNISSIAGVQPFPAIPIYSASKYAVRGLTVSWAQPAHFERTKVRVIGVCPGVTITQLMLNSKNKNLGPAYQKILDDNLASYSQQTPRQMADGMLKIIKKAKNGTIWIVEGGEDPYEFVGTDRFTASKNYL